MALQESTVSIGFGPGLDSKTDPKAASKPVLLQDCIFTAPHQISKRNGYGALTGNIVGGGTWSSPTMCKSYKNQLLLAATGPYGFDGNFTGQRLYSYSQALSAWSDQGKYVSAKVSKQTLSEGYSVAGPASLTSTSSTLANPSSAQLGNITLTAWDIGWASGASSVGFSLFDSENKTQVGSTYSIIGASHAIQIGGAPVIVSGQNYVHGFAKAVLFGTSKLAVFYIAGSNAGPDVDNSAGLYFRFVTLTAGGGVVVGSELLVSACVSSSSSADLFGYCYDVVSISAAGVFVAAGYYNSSLTTSAIILSTVSLSGAIFNQTLSLASAGGQIRPIHVCLDQSQTNAWVYWCYDTNLNYAIYPVGLGTAVLTTTAIDTSMSPVPFQVVAWAGPVSQNIYVTQNLTPASAAPLTIGVYYPQTSYGIATPTGSGASLTATLQYGVSIYGRPFSFNDTVYLPAVTLSQTEMTGFILDTASESPADPTVQAQYNAVAKFLPNAAEGVVGCGFDSGADTYVAPSYLYVRYPGFINAPNIQSSTVFSLCCAQVTQLFDDPFPTLSVGGASPSIIATGANGSAVQITFDFDHIDAYQAIVCNDTAIFNGGFLYGYDGAQITELGYHTAPDAMSLIVASSGGSGSVVNYQYWYTYSWQDQLGNLYESAPSIPVVGAVKVDGTNSATIGVAPLTLTAKKNVSINIYKSIANGNIGYLLYSVVNPPNNQWSSYADNWATDAELLASAQLYTLGDAVLDNIAAPPAMVIWTNNNRMWCVDSENPETTIEYSKTASIGTGVNFCTGTLELQIDSSYGEITGASRMDEKTVVFKETGVGFFIGDGANDSGTGSSITNFQFVPSDAGCTNSKSVILYPNGILFRSDKGIYQVNRGVQVNYFGTDVEAYNSQDIQSAVIVQNKNQIRFLTSSGLSLLYDYVMGQWSVFTNHEGLSADIFQGNYTYVRPDGSLYEEDATGSYLDNGSAIAPLVKTQWIRPGAVMLFQRMGNTALQGYQRVRRVELLGDYSNGSSSAHGCKISVAYDFGTNFSSPIAYLFGQSSSSGAFQYRESLPRQKCTAFQLIIQEVTTGASGEYIDFTDLGLEIASKRGLNKLPSGQSV